MMVSFLITKVYSILLWQPYFDNNKHKSVKATIKPAESMKLVQLEN